MFAAERELTDALIAHGLWFPSDVPGLFGWGAAFESVITAVDAKINAISASDGAVAVHFPPVIDRSIIEQTGYLQSFPELCGSVHSFCGGETEHAALLDSVASGRDWAPHLAQTAVALTPAVCYPLYPTLTGKLPAAGGLYNLASYAFRHEPSTDPARMQAFRQRENVRLGTADEVRAWREVWMARGLALLQSLALPVEIAVATDPFFGRGGRMMHANQRRDEGKFELLCPVTSATSLTALASFNYHQDKFSQVFDICLADGEFAHTACLGFGLERCALALFSIHGLDMDAWPADVVQDLGI